MTILSYVKFNSLKIYIYTDKIRTLHARDYILKSLTCAALQHTPTHDTKFPGIYTMLPLKYEPMRSNTK